MTLSRTFWRSIEAIHVPVYFAADAKAAYEAIGLKGYWMGYTASRSAALGTPPAPAVTALFHGFAPSIIERALPSAWERATPETILDARRLLARSALTPALGEADVAPVARELGLLTQGIDFAGKGLAAAHFAVPKPEDPLDQLWHAATVIREYRGDCHIAILTAAGLNGVSANVLAAAAGYVKPDQRLMCGWTEDEWQIAIDELTTRGWVDPAGEITPTGKAAREQIEDTTDRVCAAGLDREATARGITVEARLVELAKSVVASGAVAFPNPTGVKQP
jgi:hypothetical protein